MKKLLATRRRKFVAVLAVLALVGVGSAVAAWLTTLSQPAVAGKFGTLVVTDVFPQAADAAGGNCLAGAMCDGIIKVNNTGTTTLKLTGFTAGSGWNDAGSSITGAAGTCSSSDIDADVTIPAQSGLSISVPAGTSVIHIPNLFSISNSLPTGCQGATFVTTPSSGFVATFST